MAILKQREKREALSRQQQKKPGGGRTVENRNSGKNEKSLGIDEIKSYLEEALTLQCNLCKIYIIDLIGNRIYPMGAIK